MNSPRLPRMPWYPADFAGATRGWPLMARAIYRELLDAQWDMGSLPNDAQQLRGIAGATPNEWRKGWPWVREKFERGEDGRLVNRRLEEHRRAAIELHEKRQHGAAKTNRRRWGPDVVPLHDRGEHER